MADNQMVKIVFDFDLGNVPASAKKLSQYLKDNNLDLKFTKQSVDNVTASLNQFATAQNAAAQSTANAGTQLKKSNMQWTNLALVIQDLPYGFRGIQNNLPALIGGFAGMSGAIYLAGSAIIAFFTAYNMGLFESISATNEFEASNKKAIESISQEATKVALLVAQYKSSNTSALERKEIIKELNSINPQYFGNLDKEKTSIGTLNNAYLAYVGNLGNVIKAKKLEEQLTKKIEERLKYETEAGIALLKSGYRNPELINQQNAALKKYNVMLQQEAELAERITNLSKVQLQIETQKAKKDKSKEEAQKLALSIAKRLAASGGEPTFVGEPKLDPNAQAKAFAEKMAFDKKMSKERVDFLKEQYETEVSEAAGSFDKIKIAEENMRIALNQGFMDGSIKLSEYIDAITELRKKSNKTITDEANAQMQQTLKIGIGIMNALGPALDLLLEKGASIGEVLSQAFSDVIKKLVKVAIAAAVAVAIMSMIPGLIQPGKGLATFGNLIGQGMGLGANLFGAKPTANGGIFGGPSYRLVGEYPGAQSNPEVVAPLDKLKDMIGGAAGGTLEARISGSDLLILMNKAQRNNNTTF